MIPLLLAAALAASPQAVSAEALSARYAGLASLSADVVQVKEGRFWARPFESRIRLRYTPERIVWETVKPLPSTVTIEGRRLEITDARGGRRTLDGLAGDPRFEALLGFLQALLALDLPRLERDFTLQYEPDALIATPRPGAARPLFTRIVLRFDGALDLSSLLLESEAERTRLTFSKVERGGPAGR